MRRVRRSGGSQAAPACLVLPERVQLGGCGLAADIAGGDAGAFVGLPFVAGDRSVGMDGALCGSQQGIGSEARLGREGAGAGGLGVETVDAVTVLVAILVGELGCEVAGLGDLAAVEGGAAVGGPDKGADDALEVNAHGRVVHGGLQCLGGKADLLFGGLSDAVVIHGVERVGGSDLLGL